jgi:hypothetical protein
VGRSCGCSTGEKKAETRNAKLNVLRCPLPPGPQSAQLDARQATHFGSGEETPTQLDARAKGGRAGKGSSKQRADQRAGQAEKKPEGTVMGWCPKCGAEGAEPKARR